MTVETLAYTPQAVSLTDFMPQYIAYVASENVGIAPASRGAGTVMRASRKISQACEELQYGNDHTGDSLLDVATVMLDGLIERTADSDTVCLNQGAVMLGAVADIVRARNDAEALSIAYGSMQHAATTGLARLSRQANDAKMGAGERSDAVGHLAEHLGVALLTGTEGMFVMPALPHHDNRRDGAASHDLVVIAKLRNSPELLAANGRRYVTRRAQVKNSCLGFCEGDKEPPATFRKASRHYYDDIILLSAHCDFTDPEIGMGAMVGLLSGRSAETEEQPIGDHAGLVLKQRALRATMVHPPLQRLGTRSRQMPDIPVSWSARSGIFTTSSPGYGLA